MTDQTALTTTAARNDMGLAEIAIAFVKSGYFQDLKNSEQAVVKIIAGREMGFGPFASIKGIHIIQGAPSAGANLMAAAVKGSARYDYRVREMTDQVCKIEFFERTTGKPESLGLSVFTLEDARKAQTKNLDKFPRNMLFARAMSNGVRWYCPDVFGGSAVYTPEELGADVNADGDVIHGSYTTITQPASAHEMDLEQAMDYQTPKGTPLGELNNDQLRTVVDKATNGLKAAAELVLEYRIEQQNDAARAETGEGE